MKHEPGPDQTTAPVDVAIQHELHRDYETRSKANLKKVGAARLCDRPVDGNYLPRLCRRRWPGAALVPRRSRSARCGSKPRQIRTGPRSRTTTRSRARSKQHILHPRYGFPLIPPERHRCTQAAEPRARIAGQARSAGRRDGVHQSQGRGRRALDAPDDQAAEAEEGRRSRRRLLARGWRQMFRLSDYNCQDVEVEREAARPLPPLSDAEQKVWLLSNLINGAVFTSIGRSPKRRARSPRLPAPRSTPS